MPSPEAAPAPDGSPDDRRMTVGEHLEELRRRVLLALLYWVACSCVVGWYASPLMGIVLEPTMEALQATGQVTRMIYLKPTDSFGVVFKVVLILGAFVSSPFVARELWGFVAAGLYGRERRMVQWAAPVSFLLFVGGSVFFYYGVLPPALRFLYDYGRDFFPWNPAFRIESELNVADYVSFFLWMSLSMGLVFQLPLVMWFLSLLGIADAGSMAKYQRHFILGATIGAAVLTPTGDALTLCLFMLPILLLFYCGLAAVWLRERASGPRRPA